MPFPSSSRPTDAFWSWRRLWLKLLATAFGMALVAAMATPPAPASLTEIRGTAQSVEHTGKGDLEVTLQIKTADVWRGRLYRTWLLVPSKEFIGQTVDLQVGRDPVFGRERIYGAKAQRRVLVDLDASLADQTHKYRLISVISALLALAGVVVGWLTWNEFSPRTSAWSNRDS